MKVFTSLLLVSHITQHEGSYTCQLFIVLAT